MQGGVAATDLALHHDLPGRFGGVVAVSSCLLEEHAESAGRDPRSLSPGAKSTPWLVTHGTNDPRVPVAVAERLSQGLRDKGVEVTWRTYAKGHEMMRDRDEAKDIFGFLAKHLFLRDLGLERQVEQGEILEIAQGKATLERVPEGE